MPQAQLPIFPHGTTQINANLAFERQADWVTYFHGLLPVFKHHVHDTKTFHLIVSQFYDNGNATQAEMCRVFGVTPISLKRAVKCYREKGAAGFFEEPARRGAVVLTAPVPATAQQQLDEGSGIVEVAAQLSIKADTLRKAVAAGKLHCSVKKKIHHTRQTS